LIEEVNERIRYVNSHTVSGPPSTVWVVDVEAILERRRLERLGEPTDDEPSGGVAAAGEAEVAGRRRRFRWLTRRRD
jgi:hypothetical protein